jgi:SAM-dependent methyltransferase
MAVLETTADPTLPAIVDIYSIPDVYDVLHAPGTAREVGMCLRAAKRYAGEGAKAAKFWVEPACGTGRYVRGLAGRGCHALGIDLAEPMIEYARQRSRAGGENKGTARFEVGDMTALDETAGRGKFDAAMNLINSIRHLSSDKELDNHLASTAASLKAGGVYIVGLSVALYGAETDSEDVWTGARGRMKVSQVIQYVPPTATRGAAARVERAYSHITVSSPSGTREYVSSYALRCYSRKQWLDAIERSPLRLAAVVNEAGKEIDIPTLGYGIFVLRKP